MRIVAIIVAITSLCGLVLGVIQDVSREVKALFGAGND
jgi:hypothetical protein